MCKSQWVYSVKDEKEGFEFVGGWIMYGFDDFDRSGWFGTNYSSQCTGVWRIECLSVDANECVDSLSGEIDPLMTKLFYSKPMVVKFCY